MEESKKSQILKLSLIALLLSVTPLLSTSLRPTYLYFVFNLLIIFLGIESGLLSSKTSEDKRHALVVSLEAPSDKDVNFNSTLGADAQECMKQRAKVVTKSSSEKIVVVAKARKVRKCPSTPSLFFIGGGETEAEEAVEDDDVGSITGQELYHKAETFIGNFYKQLKMQREESWKKIHGLYHKAF